MTDNQTKEYEIFYFTSIALSPEEIQETKKQVSDIITKYEGTIISEEEMGKKKLAFMIKNTRHGYFIHVVFNSPAGKIDDIKKEVTLVPSVLRYRLAIKEKTNIIAPEPENQTELKPKKEVPKLETVDSIPKLDAEDKQKKKKVDLKELDLKINELLSDNNI